MSAPHLPTQMNALVLDTGTEDYRSGRGFVRRLVPTPTLNESSRPEDKDQVIVKMLYGGFCGSDKGLWFRNAFGDLITSALSREGKNWRIPGHELLGRIVALGSNVEKHYPFRLGEVVAAESHLFCGQCYQCRHGQQHVCQNAEIIGFTCDGCFAEYVKLPAKVLWPTNVDKIRPEVAALQEPFGNAVHVASCVDLRDKTVLISGCGSIGLFCFLIARQLGAKKIIGVDPIAKQLELATKLGADETILLDIKPQKGLFAAMPDVVAQVHEMTDGLGVDVAMEMAGFNTSLNNTIQATRRGGDIILFGIKSGDFVLQDYAELVLSGKRLHCVIGRRIFDTWKQARMLLEAKDRKLQGKIYEVIMNGGKETILSLADFTAAGLEKAMDEHIKVLIRFGEDRV